MFKETRLAQAKGEAEKLKEAQKRRERIETYLKAEIETKEKYIRTALAELDAKAAQSRPWWILRRRSAGRSSSSRRLNGSIRVMCRIHPPLRNNTRIEELAEFGPQEPGELTSYRGKMLVQTERSNVRDYITKEAREFELERIFGPNDPKAELLTAD
ncbi:uncharacterized protein BCR38DRAFT_479528 [Pseudomassariella vexata]|uniref:Uncharacterized protein n=1 Tax=Pseudomassariella vexata TaxID=1141098 RepID=A0A1Y2EHG0_9PEZI|nr:uncharacterized protein BCR38DRAFT_479528 [Pseudomassariella vexata]ORY70998.1 hypothetical protein BCR38DRAFT_479528 [Pseudomassariella vexata]